MEQKFESWVEETISRMEIIYRKVKETGKLNGEATRLLMDRGIQLFGLWSPAESENKSENSMKPTLTEIANEFGLSIDGNLLRIPKSGLTKEQFSKAAKRLEALGYEYKKGKSAFGPKWTSVGVKQ